jgi:hypothetical protein
VSGNSLLDFSYPAAYYKWQITRLLLSYCCLEYLITTQRYCELHSQCLYLNTVTSYGYGRTQAVTKDVWNGWEAKRPLYMNAQRTNYKLFDTNLVYLLSRSRQTARKFAQPSGARCRDNRGVYQYFCGSVTSSNNCLNPTLRPSCSLIYKLSAANTYFTHISMSICRVSVVHSCLYTDKSALT